MTLGILGLSHLALSVRDRDAAQQFWVRVLGFEVIEEQPTHCFLIERGASLGIILTDHGKTVAGAFDEHHTGLDHLAYAVPDVESLMSWAQRLDELGVHHSRVVETDAGHHLHLRAPDNFPLELFVMKPAFAAALGLEAGVDPVAVTA